MPMPGFFPGFFFFGARNFSRCLRHVALLEGARGARLGEAQPTKYVTSRQSSPQTSARFRTLPPHFSCFLMTPPNVLNPAPNA